MVAAGDAEQNSVAETLGIKQDMVVQEIGWDEDVDEDVRTAIEGRIGSELLDEDADEVVDVVLLWWREDDGDLGDGLLDARALIDESGVIWVLTPKTGQPGHVEPSDIAEAVPAAGLSQTSNASIGGSWSGTRLVPRSKSRRS